MDHGNLLGLSLYESFTFLKVQRFICPPAGGALQVWTEKLKTGLFLAHCGSAHGGTVSQGRGVGGEKGHFNSPGTFNFLPTRWRGACSLQLHGKTWTSRVSWNCSWSLPWTRFSKRPWTKSWTRWSGHCPSTRAQCRGSSPKTRAWSGCCLHKRVQSPQTVEVCSPPVCTKHAASLSTLLFNYSLHGWSLSPAAIKYKRSFNCLGHFCVCLSACMWCLSLSLLAKYISTRRIVISVRKKSDYSVINFRSQRDSRWPPANRR